MSLSSIILSRTTIARELEEGRLFLSGDAILSRTMDRWFYHWTKQDLSEVIQYKGDLSKEAIPTYDAAE